MYQKDSLKMICCKHIIKAGRVFELTKFGIHIRLAYAIPSFFEKIITEIHFYFCPDTFVCVHVQCAMHKCNYVKL